MSAQFCWKWLRKLSCTPLSGRLCASCKELRCALWECNDVGITGVRPSTDDPRQESPEPYRRSRCCTSVSWRVEFELGDLLLKWVKLLVLATTRTSPSVNPTSLQSSESELRVMWALSAVVRLSASWIHHSCKQHPSPHDQAHLPHQALGIGLLAAASSNWYRVEVSWLELAWFGHVMARTSWFRNRWGWSD